MDIIVVSYFLLIACLWLAVLRRPACALGGVLCFNGLEQWAQSQSGFFIEHSALTNFLMGVTVLLAIATRLLKKEKILAQSKNGTLVFYYPLVGQVVLALLAFSLLSILWSIYPSASQEQWAKMWPYIITIVILSPLLITKPQDLQDALFTTLIFGAITLLLLLLTSQMSGRTITLAQGDVSLEKAGNPLFLASLGGYVALIGVTANFRGNKMFWTLIRWLALGLGLAIAFKTGSRGQLFGILLGTIIFLPLSRGVSSWRTVASTFILLLLAALMVLWTYDQFVNSGQVDSRWNTESMSQSVEEHRLSTAAKLLDHWSQGGISTWLVGLGSSASFDPNILGTYPHLVLAEVLAEEGIVGFLLYCLMIGLSLRTVVRLYRISALHKEIRGLVASMGALFFFELLLTFKQGSMLGNMNILTFAIMLGRFEWAILKQERESKLGTAPVKWNLGSRPSKTAPAFNAARLSHLNRQNQLRRP